MAPSSMPPESRDRFGTLRCFCAAVAFVLAGTGALAQDDPNSGVIPPPPPITAPPAVVIPGGSVPPPVALPPSGGSSVIVPPGTTPVLVPGTPGTYPPGFAPVNPGGTAPGTFPGTGLPPLPATPGGLPPFTGGTGGTGAGSTAPRSSRVTEDLVLGPAVALRMRGQALFNSVSLGHRPRACAGCHQPDDLTPLVRGYPRPILLLGRVGTFREAVEACARRYQDAPGLPDGARNTRALLSFLGAPH